jgi:hypothetical protein
MLVLLSLEGPALDALERFGIITPWSWVPFKNPTLLQSAFAKNAIAKLQLLLNSINVVQPVPLVGQISTRPD